MILYKKMMRDIMHHKLVYISSALVIVIGLSMYTSMFMVMENLQAAMDEFYEDSNFAHGFASLTGVPVGAVDELQGTEGVESLQGRFVKDVRIYEKDLSVPRYLRLVSVDLEEERLLNSPFVEEGAPLEKSSDGVWLDVKFYDENSVSPGDGIEIIAEGKRVELDIIGSAISPDFIYAMRSLQEIYPDPSTFGIAYIEYSKMESLFREKGIYNEISFTIEEGYTYDEVESRLEDKLKKYGLKSIYEREDQVSHSILTGELEQLQGTALVFPLIFLAVASFVLYIMLKRIVEQQRGQIGILKAFGYTKREILLHYMSYSMIVGVAGGIFGGLAGIWLAYFYTELYREFFAFPNLSSTFSMKYFVQANIISILFSIVAGYSGTRKILMLKPADALRPPVLVKVHTIWLERIRALWKMFGTQTKMAFRNLFRNRARSLFTMIGIVFVFSIVTTTVSFQRVIEIMMKEQFEKVQTYDVKMSFYTPIDRNGTYREIVNRDYIREAEAFLEAPIKIKSSWREKEAICIGMQIDGRMYNIIDSRGNILRPPIEGMIISEKIANIMDISVGDTVEIESPWAAKDEISVTITGIIPQHFGVNTYMEISSFCKLIGQRDMATSLLLDIEDGQLGRLNDDYINAQNVVSIERREKTIETFNELMESYAYMQWIFVVFGIIAGFAVIYTSSTIIFSERQRELSSLRVLGMTKAEIFRIIAIEQWAISAGAIAIGVPVAYIMRDGIARGVSTDLFSIPLGIDAASFLASAVVTFVSIAFAQISVYRKIRRLNFVDVLKERE
ncbi:putative ABC transport system permease protein [Peptoclostridium litorale DSM 5388]|uniref:ABC-type transport system, involved in lipoprotein release, permease component n=1 Tax=Peptoclostridium litorale DSM 5388 TaxID=1121324 RepID=A0A069RCF6_PEPLI|nr:ABC transporter permease [Peptoclostridium litorale]KDR94696.1 ABC-type transport system, involved in lipoprotein release, permease component [Peptoclostridium litorale DSM 5388]SIO32747.1 putative ABC transport system permease protein [Peptoclostridium litorale DSM 5388]